MYKDFGSVDCNCRNIFRDPSERFLYEIIERHEIYAPLFAGEAIERLYTKDTDSRGMRISDFLDLELKEYVVSKSLKSLFGLGFLEKIQSKEESRYKLSKLGLKVAKTSVDSQGIGFRYPLAFALITGKIHRIKCEGPISIADEILFSIQNDLGELESLIRNNQKKLSKEDIKDIIKKVNIFIRYASKFSRFTPRKEIFLSIGGLVENITGRNIVSFLNVI